MSKKNIKKSKIIMRILAFASLFQTGCATLPFFQKAPYSESIQCQSSSCLVENLTPDEKKFWVNFMKTYSQKSPAAKKILNELIRQGARMEFFSEPLGKDNLFWAGRSDEDTLSLNRDIEAKKVSLSNTFFHEAEHVIHLKRAHQNGINARSFSSLDDVFVYATLLEALAYRKAELCCAEYKGEKKALQLANNVFLDRLKMSDKPIEERLSYENSAFIAAALETNSLPNQVYFKKNPDWNKVVSILSRGEVRKLPVLPQPTVFFLGKCLADELDKHPNARKLEELDISCVLANKSTLQKKDKEIKQSISNLLIQIFDTCHKIHPLSKETQSKFLYLIGWPDLEQKQKLDRKEVKFQDIRDQNLSKFKTADLFNYAIRLVQSPEVQSYGNPQVKRLEQILKFEKIILLPQKSKTKQQVR